MAATSSIDRAPERANRREFLKCSLSLTAAATAASVGGLVGLGAAEPAGAGEAAARLKAAVIGHTGRGDYGHGLDVVFNDLPGVRVAAVADPDPAGRAKAAEKCKAPRQYDDYRAMLEKEKPHLVSVAPRWSDQHLPMCLAAFAAGAHVYMEKPITPTLAEADELLAAADKAGRKVAVAHQMRMAPSVTHLKRRIDGGLLGDLLQMNAWGKQDARAGGEDMLVLGTHLFDLMRLFAGDAQWCTARVLQQGRDITPADARGIKEQIGPVAGDEIFAQFAFPGGVSATFTSRAKMRDRTGHWGIELIGSKATARILADIWPHVLVTQGGKWDKASGRTDEWRPLEDDPSAKATAADRSTDRANRRLVDDWLAAIREDREPTCSGRNAMKALEMVMAVYRAALSGGRAALPLKDRTHPLAAGRQP